MPRTVSVSAFLASADGASQSRPYHARMRSRASVSLTLNGSTLSGRCAGVASVVRHELRGAAEFAVLRLAGRIEHRDRVAALALDFALGDPCVAGSGPRVAQGADEVVLGDLALGIELRGGLGAAERTHETAFRRDSRRPRHRTPGQANFDNATLSVNCGVLRSHASLNHVADDAPGIVGADFERDFLDARGDRSRMPSGT